MNNCECGEEWFIHCLDCEKFFCRNDWVSHEHKSNKYTYLVREMEVRKIDNTNQWSTRKTRHDQKRHDFVMRYAIADYERVVTNMVRKAIPNDSIICFNPENIPAYAADPGRYGPYPRTLTEDMKIYVEYNTRALHGGYVASKEGLAYKENDNNYPIVCEICGSEMDWNSDNEWSCTTSEKHHEGEISD